MATKILEGVNLSKTKKIAFWESIINKKEIKIGTLIYFKETKGPILCDSVEVSKQKKHHLQKRPFISGVFKGEENNFKKFLGHAYNHGKLSKEKYIFYME